jgi:hypothetical protein
MSDDDETQFDIGFGIVLNMGELLPIALGGLLRAVPRIETSEAIGLDATGGCCVWLIRAEVEALAQLDDYPIVLKPLIDELRDLLKHAPSA